MAALKRAARTFRCDVRKVFEIIVYLLLGKVSLCGKDVSGLSSVPSPAFASMLVLKEDWSLGISMKDVLFVKYYYSLGIYIANVSYFFSLPVLAYCSVKNHVHVS